MHYHQHNTNAIDVGHIFFCSSKLKAFWNGKHIHQHSYVLAHTHTHSYTCLNWKNTYHNQVSTYRYTHKHTSIIKPTHTPTLIHINILKHNQVSDEFVCCCFVCLFLSQWPFIRERKWNTYELLHVVIHLKYTRFIHWKWSDSKTRYYVQ